MALTFWKFQAMCKFMMLLLWHKKCQGGVTLGFRSKTKCTAEQAPTRSHLTHCEQDESCF